MQYQTKRRSGPFDLGDLTKASHTFLTAFGPCSVAEELNGESYVEHTRCGQVYQPLQSVIRLIWQKASLLNLAAPAWLCLDQFITSSTANAFDTSFMPTRLDNKTYNNK